MAKISGSFIDLVVQKLSKTMGEFLGIEVSEASAREALSKSGEKLNMIASGGEAVETAPALNILAEEIAAKKQANRVPIARDQKDVERIIGSRVASKANQLRADMMKIVRSVDDSGEVNVGVAEAFVKRANSMGIKNVSVADFYPQAKEGTLENGAVLERGIDVVNRVVRDKIVPHYKTQFYLRSISDLSSQLASISGADSALSEYARVLKKHKLSVSEMDDAEQVFQEIQRKITDKGDVRKAEAISRDLFSTVSAARSLQLSAIDRELSIGALDKLTMTPSDMTARISAFARNNNMPELATSMENLYAHLQNLDPLNARIQSIRDGILADWKPYAGTEDELKLRRYISTMNVDRAMENKLFKESELFDSGIPVDPYAARDAGLYDAEGNLLVDKSFFQTAIRTQNSLRVLRKVIGDVHSGDFEPHTSLLRSYDQMIDSSIRTQGDKTGHFSSAYGWMGENFSVPGYDSFGDLGHNYFPIRINEQHRAKISSHLREMGLGDTAFDSQFGWQRVRQIDSQAEIDENRLLPTEELKYYFDSVLTDVMRKPMNDAFSSARKSIRAHDVLGLFTGSHVPQDIAASVRRGSRKDIETAVDDLEAFCKSSFTATPNAYDRDIVTSFVAGMTDLNTSLALSVFNPRNFVFNALQDLQTSSTFKAFESVMKAQGVNVQAGAFLADGKGSLWKKLGGEGPQLFEKHFRENTKDFDFRKAVNYYFDNFSPDVVMGDIYDESPGIKKMLRFLSGPYTMTDILSRAKAIYAAVDFGKKYYDKNLVDVAKDPISMAKARKQIMKDLHLGEFNHIQVDQLFKKMGNREEFLNHFAALSTHNEMFNYSRFNRPRLIEMARTYHPLTARATRFLSWNIYYTNLLKGVYRSYKMNDDPRPLIAMAGVSAAWFSAMSAGAGVDSPWVQDYAQYGKNRTPFFMPALGMTSQGFQPSYGIMASSIATLMGPLVWALDTVSDIMSNQQDDLDRLNQITTRAAMGAPLLKIPQNIWDTIKGEEK